MNLGDLAYPDVPEGAVHLLPLGATEPHGPHAPLSTDTLISVGICERAAEQLAGEIPVLVLPGGGIVFCSSAERACVCGSGTTCAVAADIAAMPSANNT